MFMRSRSFRSQEPAATPSHWPHSSGSSRTKSPETTTSTAFLCLERSSRRWRRSASGMTDIDTDPLLRARPIWPGMPGTGNLPATGYSRCRYGRPPRSRTARQTPRSSWGSPPRLESTYCGVLSQGDIHHPVLWVLVLRRSKPVHILRGLPPFQYE